MQVSSRRSLLLPLLFSLSLHGALLLAWPRAVGIPAGVARRAIEARLVVAPRPLPSAAQAPPVAPRPVLPAVLGQALDERRPPARSGRGEGPGKVMDRPSHGTVARQRPADRGLDATQTVFSDADADALRQYRLALAIAARRYKPEAPLSGDGRWQGTVRIALELRARGEPRAAVYASSGDARLDALAQQMLLRAAGATVLPEGLVTRELRLVVAVEFGGDSAP